MGRFVLGFIVAWIVFSLFWGIGKKGRYEGMTAEEWSDYYQSAYYRCGSEDR